MSLEKPNRGLHRMGHKPNAVHRKMYAPWYDTDTVCMVIILAMLLVLPFALIGITSAVETVAYQSYVWVPTLLAAMTLWVLLSTLLRLVKRHVHRD